MTDLHNITICLFTSCSAEGLRDKDRNLISAVLSQVGSLNAKDNSYSLAPHLHSQVRLDWPDYRPEEVDRIKTFVVAFDCVRIVTNHELLAYGVSVALQSPPSRPSTFATNRQSCTLAPAQHLLEPLETQQSAQRSEDLRVHVTSTCILHLAVPAATRSTSHLTHILSYMKKLDHLTFFFQQQLSCWTCKCIST